MNLYAKKKDMKRYALIGVLAIAAMTACKTDNSQQAEQARQDSIRQADSLAAVADAAEKADAEREEQRLKDSVEWVAFQSKDLVFLELHGHVQTVKTNYKTYALDEDGMITSADGKDPFNCSYEKEGDAVYCLNRNEEGYIASETGWEWGTDYEWKDGRIVSYYNTAEAWTTKARYSYDDEGNIIRQKGTSSEFEGEVESFDYKYSYKKRDAYGNWTERSYNGITEKRTITYYANPFAK